METIKIKIKIIHPETSAQVEIDAPVSKLKIPVDIFFNGQDVLIIRFKGATKRRAILETDENNHIVTKAKGKTWRFAGVALITRETSLFFTPPYKRHTIPDNDWNYSEGNGWRSNKACT